MPQRTSHERPLFLEAAENLAREQGTDPERLLAQYLQAVRDSSYPEAECFDPDEVEQFVLGEELPAQRRAHAESCLPCSTLLKAARPSPERRRQVIAAVRYRELAEPPGTAQPLSAFRAAFRRRPLVLGAQLFAIGFLGGLYVSARRRRFKDAFLLPETRARLRERENEGAREGEKVSPASLAERVRAVAKEVRGVIKAEARHQSAVEAATSPDEAAVRHQETEPVGAAPAGSSPAYHR